MEFNENNINEAESFLSGKMSGRVLSFNDFLFEHEQELNEGAMGFGDKPFFLSKNGDTLNYFFKIQDSQDKNGFVISIGKFAKFAKPTEQKTDYGVLSLTKLKVEDLDQAVVDAGKFTTNLDVATLTEQQLNKLLLQLSLIIEDYLQKHPTVSIFYDEMQSNLAAPDYDNKFAISLSKWPGGSEQWHLQVLEKNRLNSIKK